MSSTNRQYKLLLAEDWKQIYQSFKYGDFKSYDFDTLRRTMIDYLRTNYPEDFNDYIESSEYLALIDMIAFLGQNLSFRVDLNARENFLELAERRESVLRLARLVSYNPKRNQTSNGLLKITSVSTTENVIDSNGNNLSGKTIVWNDTVNTNWFEQFVKVINASLPVTNTFGNPILLQTVSGIPTEIYRFNASSTGVPVYSFNKPVNNLSMDFEAISSTIDSTGNIIEEPPLPGNNLSFLYRDNGQGAGSTSTGFFVQFKQGSLQRGDFTIDYPVPNQKIDIDVTNINNSDVWLYKLDTNGNENTLWTKVDAVEGNNIVYNSLNKNIKDIFSVLTRVDDRISLIFSDGVFGNLPKGSFRVYYRTSINKDYVINAGAISNISISVPYTSKSGRIETITMILTLQNSVSNAASSESTDSIKTNAPATYYTQNRLITGEDYNIGPLSVSQDIIKVKSVNRTSSGISRYYDILDPTGKYSSTNIFGADGILYKEFVDNIYNFSFLTKTDIEGIITNNITSILKDYNLRNFYYDQYYNQDYSSLSLSWNLTSSSTNRSTGTLQDSTGIAYAVSSFTDGPLKFIEPGAMVKFIPAPGTYFLPDGTTTTNSAAVGAKSYKWVTVVSVSGNGTTVTNGIGPIVFNDIIPNGSLLSAAKPKFVNSILTDVTVSMIDQIFAYNTFGLRYDRNTRQWAVITPDNLNVTSNFSLGLTGDVTGQQLDSSWLLLFETNGSTYKVTYRTIRYVFESDSEVKFYYDSNNKIYDTSNSTVVKDRITVLNINTDINSTNKTLPLTTDYTWQIFKEYKDISGYVNTKKLEVVFYDSNDDGIVDDPDIFNQIVDTTKYIFTQNVNIDNSTFNIYIDAYANNIQTVTVFTDINLLAENNPIYYVSSIDTFYQLNSKTRSLTELYNYRAFIGRPNLKFQYYHASNQNNRIDPSRSNIIDTYILTKQYDTAFRQYLNGTITSMPLPPSSNDLYLSYGSAINQIKSISDEVIYHPVQYRILFGSMADNTLQATFKIVKNPDVVINDNTLKSNVISSINKFFALDNWNFGDTFFWSELEAYIMKDQAPNISSIILVPNNSNQTFGSLFQVNADSNEIFISGATVNDIEIITAITADRLKASGSVITSAYSTNTGITSATPASSSTTGGYIY